MLTKVPNDDPISVLMTTLLFFVICELDFSIIDSFHQHVNQHRTFGRHSITIEAIEIRQFQRSSMVNGTSFVCPRKRSQSRETKVQITGLHLEIVRMRRGWRKEPEDVMEQYMDNLKDLREEN
ncbi:uncharacterized protein BT62DRAFT_3976 [Guyanagaster necrorhizus]|uniref:Uncharacterized protein n=1 Tax=Guyanagaster necrorhizus TaxID=856835 RepID=A0A9P7W324_9AGAR|nr:uncharacterized protein BT62DRAFT_3976 [Guyanagaster necrorhizus MCA 3950]KAG7452476.1 hypothetical protein BT62DRAFT_3976 [Guyanagaster necrorhizus MCA 3950]